MTKLLDQFTPDLTPAISRGAVLIDLRMGTWTARKKNKEVASEVALNKKAKTSASASVYTHLLADCEELARVNKHVAKVRLDHIYLTKVWNDTGTRLIPTAMLQRYEEFITDSKQKFEEYLEEFLARYDLLVSKAAFTNGELYKEEDYPSVDEVRSKFYMRHTFSPVPTSGDFRLDLEADVMADIANQYEEEFERRIVNAQTELMDNVRSHLERMVKGLGYKEDGKKNVFHDTLVSQAIDMVDMLGAYNFNNDPALSKLRVDLNAAISGKTPEVLRSSDEARDSTRDQVKEILDALDW